MKQPKMKLEQAKKKYDAERIYRYCVCTLDNKPHTLCKTLDGAEDVVKHNTEFLKIVDLEQLAKNASFADD